MPFHFLAVMKDHTQQRKYLWSLETNQRTKETRQCKSSGSHSHSAVCEQVCLFVPMLRKFKRWSVCSKRAINPSPRWCAGNTLVKCWPATALLHAYTAVWAHTPSAQYLFKVLKLASWHSGPKRRQQRSRSSCCLCLRACLKFCTKATRDHMS